MSESTAARAEAQPAPEGFAFERAGPGLASALGAVALLGAPDLTLPECTQAALLLATVLAAWKIVSHAEGKAAVLWARPALALVFIYSISLGLPAFQTAGCTSLSGPNAAWPWARMVAALAIIAILVWMDFRSAGAETAPAAADERLEAFLLSPSSRAGLFLLGAGTGACGAVLRGLGPSHALWAGALLGALALALRPLVRLGRITRGSRLLCVSTVLLLGLFVAGGAARWGLAQANVAAARDGKAALKYAEDYNAALRSPGLEADIETLHAGIAEAHGRAAEARARWKAAAECWGMELSEFVPGARGYCRLGDGSPAWRRLLKHGFPSLRGPEWDAALEALLRHPDAGLRGRLLAALGAWDAGASESVRRERLDAVQKLLPGELTSRILLGRMGEPLPAGQELILSGELFFPSPGDSPGGLEPFDGESAEALAVLDEGTWKGRLEAAGSPLLEEWPTVRLEVNGRTAARVRIADTDPRGYPLELKAERNDAYRIRLVFENGRPVDDRGRRVRRWLSIKRIVLRKEGGG